MSTIPVGSAVTFNLGDGQNLETASNGGFYKVQLTPNLTGITTTSVQGPNAHAHSFGPYAAGAVLVITNQSVNTLTYVPPPDGSVFAATPSTEAADRALTASDANRILVCAAARAFTVNSGMPAYFGPAAVGVGLVTWTAGSGVAITDNRTTGATNPSCCLLPVGPDTYYVVGSKA